ncbi:MAG TPA: Hsp70 family protein [Pyrinomonadaceae bacterium]|nr:Hsp70 family protein [Pyrinomonadaceae bacterium]
MNILRALFGKSPKPLCVGVFISAPVELNSPMVGIDGVCVESLGIETSGDVFTPLIRKGSRIPCRADEIFSTAAHSQTSIQINVFRGDKGKVAETYPLGVYEIIDIPPLPPGQPQIHVGFEITRMRDIYMSAEWESTREKMKIRKYLKE